MQNRENSRNPRKTTVTAVNKRYLLNLPITTPSKGLVPRSKTFFGPAQLQDGKPRTNGKADTGLPSRPTTRRENEKALHTNHFPQRGPRERRGQRPKNRERQF